MLAHFYFENNFGIIRNNSLSKLEKKPNIFHIIDQIKVWDYRCESSVAIFEWKEIESLPQTQFYNPYIFATQCHKPLIFKTFNSLILSLKCQRFTIAGCENIGIINYILRQIFNSFTLTLTRKKSRNQKISFSTLTISTC